MAVVALDGGNPPKSGSILVDISIADVNDNAPVFDNDTYEVRLTNVLSLCGGHYYDTNKGKGKGFPILDTERWARS